MDKAQKLKAKLLAGQGLHNFAFHDLVLVVESIGFVRQAARSGTSHLRFVNSTIPELIVLQPDRGRAKTNQLRQVQKLIKKYDL